MSVIQFNLSYITKDQTISTSDQGKLLSRRLTIKAGDALNPVKITFNVRGK